MEFTGFRSRWRLRQATMIDAGAISTLLLCVASQFIFPDLPAEGRRQLQLAFSEDAIARLLTDDTYYVVAETSMPPVQLIGVIALRKPCHLYHFFVADTFQGQGLARQLLDAIMPLARRWSDDGALTVNASRYALPIYHHFGFEPQGPMRELNGVLDFPMALALDHYVMRCV